MSKSNWEVGDYLTISGVGSKYLIYKVSNMFDGNKKMAMDMISGRSHPYFSNVILENKEVTGKGRERIGKDDVRYWVYKAKYEKS